MRVPGQLTPDPKTENSACSFIIRQTSHTRFRRIPIYSYLSNDKRWYFVIKPDIITLFTRQEADELIKRLREISTRNKYGFYYDKLQYDVENNQII